MTSTLNVPLQLMISAVVHEIEGGGFWAEVPRFPGCVAQAETRETLVENLCSAIDDWLSESPEKTEAEARQLAAIQASRELPDASYPIAYDYLPPPSRADEDE